MLTEKEKEERWFNSQINAIKKLMRKYKRLGKTDKWVNLSNSLDLVHEIKRM